MELSELRSAPHLEGKFGQGKLRFGLSKIMCKLVQTSETTIAITFLVMNLEKWLKVFIFFYFLLLLERHPPSGVFIGLKILVIALACSTT